MDAKLLELLEEQRAVIVQRWRDLVIDSYSKDAARFMRKEQDPFANPMGSTIARVIDQLWEGLVGERELGDLATATEDICRIRAVQEFAPSEALAFVPLVKEVIRDVLSVDEMDATSLRALMQLEARVDQMLLLAFDGYTACRERIFEIRTTEIRSRSERVLTALNDRFERRVAATGSSEDSPTPVTDGKGGGSR